MKRIVVWIVLFLWILTPLKTFAKEKGKEKEKTNRMKRFQDFRMYPEDRRLGFQDRRSFFEDRREEPKSRRDDSEASRKTKPGDTIDKTSPKKVPRVPETHDIIK